MASSTEQQILEQAIQNAIDGGWKYSTKLNIGWADVDAVLNNYHLELDDERYDEDNYLYFIFNHDFAKALWGEELNGNGVPKYMHHLMFMVIAEDPIKYLGENI